MTFDFCVLWAYVITTLAVSQVHAASDSVYVKIVVGDNKVKWVPHTSFNVHDKNIRPAGLKWTGDKYLDKFVARVAHEGGHLVGGWYKKEKNIFLGGLRGDEKEVKDVPIELLSVPKGVVSWIPVEEPAHLPADDGDMIVAGKYPGTGEALYICRAVKNQELIIGRFLKSDGVCMVPFEGAERKYDIFELLVKNMLFKIIGTTIA